MTTIIDMGGDDEKRFGYDFSNQVVFIKEQTKDTMKYKGLAILGPYLGTLIYSSLSKYNINISSLNWLLLSSVLLIILTLLFWRLGLSWVEHSSDWVYFEELEKISNKDSLFLKELGNRNGMIVFSVCTAVFGVAAALPLGNLYVTSSDLIFWWLYICMLELSIYGIIEYWFYQRQKKLRKLMISQIELKENNNN